MRKTLVSALLGAGLVVAAAPKANATDWTPVASCSTGAFQVCAVIQASTVQVGTQWHLVLKVWNLYTNAAYAGSTSHVITFAGIGSSWSGTATLVGATFNGGAVSWATNDDPNNNVVGAAIDAGAKGNNGVNQGLVGCTAPTGPGAYQTCYPGNSLVLDFTTSTQFTFANAEYGWHSQVVNGTSCSLWVDSNGHQTADSAGDCATTATPEPITMLLLGTGLVGMGGMRGLRRKRREDEIA